MTNNKKTNFVMEFYEVADDIGDAKNLLVDLSEAELIYLFNVLSFTNSVLLTSCHLVQEESYVDTSAYYHCLGESIKDKLFDKLCH